MSLDLPDMPARVARLPKDARGYPVPWFVMWLKDGAPAPRGVGEPDFRILADHSREVAVKKHLCWICGEPMGVHQVFVVGPMCTVNRTSQEPPLHRDCAEFSAKACPFLTRPRQKRDKKNLPLEGLHADGDMIERNPGAVALWESRFSTFTDGRGGWLIKLLDPVRVDWWAKGRRATRAEIEASIESGYPLLYDVARRQSPEAVAELERLRAEAMRYLPEAA